MALSLKAYRMWLEDQGLVATAIADHLKTAEDVVLLSRHGPVLPKHVDLVVEAAMNGGLPVDRVAAIKREGLLLLEYERFLASLAGA